MNKGHTNPNAKALQRILGEWRTAYAPEPTGYVGYKTWEALGKPADYLVWTGDGWVRAKSLLEDELEYESILLEFESRYEPWTDDTGREWMVHKAEHCTEPCPIHAPSDHSMKDMPRHFRGDRGMMERICGHGVGHPDPDDIMNEDKTHGCCQGACCGRSD